MAETTRQRSGQTANALHREHHKNTTTAIQIESLSRLHGGPATLVEHARQLVTDMRSKLPDDGLQVGVLHQLQGRSLYGALCTSIIVFEGSHAVFVDYNTGVHVTVDAAGIRRTSLLGPSR